MLRNISNILRRFALRSFLSGRVASYGAASGLLLPALGFVSACQVQPKTPEEAWKSLREKADGSAKESLLTEWLMAESLRPGGEASQALRAQEQLLESDQVSLQGSLLLALSAELHVDRKDSAQYYLEATQSARDAQGEDASLFAHYAMSQLEETADLDFLKAHVEALQELKEHPGSIGFRAIAKVLQILARLERADGHAHVDDKLSEGLGCKGDIRLAGPFGHDPNSDILHAFSAERPGPWPQLFSEEGQNSAAHQLTTQRFGCDVQAAEPTARGVFYAESYLVLSQPQDVILAAAGATRLWVDDQLVLDRDIRQWGIWPKFGASIHLKAGRHRVLWKLADAATGLRVTSLNGQPAVVATSKEAGLGYQLSTVKVLADPNPLMAFVPELKKPARIPENELTRYVAARLLAEEGQADVATVLFEPLIEAGEDATGLALQTAASFVTQDPIYDKNQRRDLVHELQLRAEEKDPGLWYSRLRNAVFTANAEGPVQAVEALRGLVEDFPHLAAVHYHLARLYEELGWVPELEQLGHQLVEQFPRDPDVIRLGVHLFEVNGELERVDELLGLLRELEPESDYFVSRALEAQDYGQALEELKRLLNRSPKSKNLLQRIIDLQIRAGDEDLVWQRLEQAVQEENRDVHARLGLADAQFARGESNALSQALAASVESGSDASLIEAAIDLVEGLTELEPYRLDALQVIAEYEKSARHQDGTAARILDYGAVWIRSGGSSRFLEHEVVRLQSEEGIAQFAEMNTNGLILQLRVIKKDGRILEPEAVPGKPTATMPHLEVGDYIEQERILTQWGDANDEVYAGPHWFFREAKVAYARSEFVVISPVGKELQLEASAGVPEPEVLRNGAFIARRYRVNDSPAAPVEPMSPPAQEFLPSLAIGWGNDFDHRLRVMARSMISMSPTDPRIRRIALKIVEEKNAGSQSERARALYRWVLDSVQEGRQSDGRRVVVSRSGNRWQAYLTLARALDIPVRWALAESSLASPPKGEISTAQRPLFPLLVVGEGEETEWLTVKDKFSPYGSIPSHLIGQAAYLLDQAEVTQARVPQTGVVDAIRYVGTGSLEQDGSAQLNLEIIFEGKYAASLRDGLSQIPSGQLPGIIESRLLGNELPGARLLSHEVVAQDQLDQPLSIRVIVAVPQLATQTGDGLLLSAPFMPRLSGMTPLAARKTPLMISDTNQQSLELSLSLAPGLIATTLQFEQQVERSSFEVKDHIEGALLVLSRDVRTRAGRISPENYQEFQRYAANADQALNSAVVIQALGN